jgi:hypothetical protein
VTSAAGRAAESGRGSPAWLVPTLGWALFAVGLVGCFLWMMDTDAKLQAAGQAPFDDWRTYSHAVQRFLSGEPIYAAAQLGGPYQMPRTVNIGYSYPPPSLLLFLPFAGEPVGLIAWLSLNATLLISGIAAILRSEVRLRLSWALALSSLSLAIFYPFANGMAVGNVNVGVAGLFAWTWVLRDRSRITGTIAGVAAMVKIFPGAIALWPPNRAAVRSVMTAALVFLGMGLATLPIFGFGAWGDFFTALKNQQPTCRDEAVSVACVIGPIVGLGFGKVVGIGLAVVLAVLALFARGPFVRYACLGGAMLAPVTDGWPHYWLFVYVVIVAGAASILHQRRMLPGIGSGDRRGFRASPG